MSKKKKEQQKAQLPRAATVKKPSAQPSVPLAANEQKHWYNNTPLLMGILAVAVLLAFIAAFGNDFINYDDNCYVTNNPFVQKATFASLLTLLKVECAFNYHPLTMVTYWLNARLFGLGPSSFIITNTAFHIINTLLIFLFTRRLTKNNNWVAFFTALLWGIHPLRNESVTWISERKDVLYTCFFMLSSIKYIDFIETSKRKYLAYSFIFFIVSCLAKGMAVVLPLVLVLLDYWFDQEWLSAKRLLQKVPFFIVSLLFGLLTIDVQSGGTLGGRITKLSGIGDSAIHSKLSFLQRFIFGFYGFWVYIFKNYIPYGLHNYYTYPRPAHYYDAQYLLAPLLAIALLVFAARQYKRNKIFFFGIMYFFATIIIVLQFIAVGDNMLSERYSYIPSFGLIFMTVYWLSEKVKWSTLAPVFTIIAAVFMFLTYRQTLTYKDTGSVFLNSYEYSPYSTVVNEFVMDYYGEQGDYQKVLSYGETALENNVVSFKIFVRLAKAFYFMGDKDKALEIWKQAIPMSPEKDRKSVYCERGMMYRDMGRYKESATDFDSAIALNEKYRYEKKFRGIIHYERGLTYRMGSDYPEAVADFDSALKYNPDAFDSIIREKAYTELMAKQWHEAETDYTTMISKNIAKDTAYYNRGCAYFNLGQKQDAINDLKAALKINPGYEQAKANLSQLEQVK